LIPSSLSFINESFPTETDITPWIAAVPSLALCILSLFVGELSDIFGRRWFLITGNFLCLIGNIVCGRASSAKMVIGGQILNGMGMTLGYLSTPLIAEAVPKRSRGIVLGLAVGLAGVVTTGGSIMQGAMVKREVGGALNGWRGGVYVGAGVSALALILTALFYHPGRRPNPEGLSVGTRFRSLDWFGIFLGSSALILILVGLQLGGNSFPWDSATVLSLLIVGIVVLIVFAIWEWKFVKFGVFPRQLFKDRNYSVIISVQMIEGIVVNTTAAFLTQISYTLFTSDPLAVYVRNIDYGIGTLLGAPIAGFVLWKTREARWLLFGAVTILTIACGLMAVLQPHINYAAWFFPTFIIGICSTCLGVGISVVASISTPNEFIATALSLCNSIRGLGGSIGIVVFSSIFEAKLKANLPKEVSAAVIAAGLPPTSVPLLLYAVFVSNDTDATLATVPGITLRVGEAIAPAVAQSYADSWRYIWYALVPFCAVTALATLLIRSTKAKITQEVASPVMHFHGHYKTDERV
jgi:MFS family permease